MEWRRAELKGKTLTIPDNRSRAVLGSTAFTPVQSNHEAFYLAHKRSYSSLLLFVLIGPGIAVD